MESLESKLDRLSPEQRKETEDFVDFLLARSERVHTPSDASHNALPVLNLAPPPLTPIEPVHEVETRSIGMQNHVFTDHAPQTGDESDPAPFQEIGGGITDRISHDYMDYGQFESQPSPATEAVKKVKRKLIAREGQDKPRHLLDWVD
jgi:hypothetical protein